MANPQLVEAVLNHVKGNERPPEPILRGLATGFTSSTWEESPEVTYLQLAVLVVEASQDPETRLDGALNTLLVIGHASTDMLLEAWRGEAEVDALTQLGNRRRRDSVARQLQDTKTPFAYASIDVDGLKSVNDGQGGHDAGDRLLKSVANALRTKLRESSGEVFRYGGDEFGVILSKPGGEDSLGSILKSIVDHAQDFAFSFGTSMWPSDDSDVHTVFAYADEKMYIQKHDRKGNAKEQ